MNEKLDVVAIDGPAGSGKSTVAKRLAQKLGWVYIDTGAMYRALCLAALKNSIDVNNESKLIDLLESIDISLDYQGNGVHVYLNSDDVSKSIRNQEVSEYVSDVASHPGVRKRLVEEQRKMGRDGEVVMEGRDIGSVVFPDAKHKFYLDASLEIRARRRYNQLENSEKLERSIESIKQEIKHRDETDKARSTGPLEPSDDAIRVDTSDLTVEEVVNTIQRAINKKCEN